MILRTMFRLLLMISSAFHTVHNASFIRIDTRTFENVCAVAISRSRMSIVNGGSFAGNVTHLQKDAVFFRISSERVIALCAMILCDKRSEYTLHTAIMYSSSLSFFLSL